MNATTIGQLELGSLAVINYFHDRASFTAYAIRLAQVREGDVQVPMLVLGPKPTEGEHGRPGVSHPVFYDADATAACYQLSLQPIVEPIFDEQRTGIETVRQNFGHPQGLSKLFLVGTQKLIGVSDRQDDLYFVSTDAWRLTRDDPHGRTAVCTRWRVRFKYDPNEEVGTVVATFG